jgi:hypothetical protein
MDFGAIIKAPTQDPDWIKKCAIMGLFAIIPIAGILNLMGWMKAVYARVKAGDTTLPDAGFSYLGSGWELFLAILPAILVNFGVNVLVGILNAVVHSSAVASLGALLSGLVGLAIGFVVQPTLLYRHVVHNTGFGAAMDVPANMSIITTNTGLFATFVVLYFLSGLIGGLGFIACCVGAVVTFPFGMAISANAIKAFEDANGGL